MAAKLTHGVVEACTCSGLRVPPKGKTLYWPEQGHHPDCPAAQPGDPHGCTCAERKGQGKWTGEGHHPDCPAYAKVRGVSAA
jgi:hypothetical protein